MLADENDDLLLVTTCALCGKVFTGIPSQTCTICLDANGVPPDKGGDPQTASYKPVCPNCVRKTNAWRRQHGMTVLWPDPQDDD